MMLRNCHSFSIVESCTWEEVNGVISGWVWFINHFSNSHWGTVASNEMKLYGCQYVHFELAESKSRRWEQMQKVVPCLLLDLDNITWMVKAAVTLCWLSSLLQSLWFVWQSMPSLEVQVKTDSKKFLHLKSRQVETPVVFVFFKLLKIYLWSKCHYSPWLCHCTSVLPVTIVTKYIFWHLVYFSVILDTDCMCYQQKRWRNSGLEFRALLIL